MHTNVLGNLVERQTEEKYYTKLDKTERAVGGGKEAWKF